ncbi:MAG: 4a-hydroxytetrahydrobiopterin dehydratase [Vulcanimicrobiaceae bacterium]
MRTPFVPYIRPSEGQDLKSLAERECIPCKGGVAPLTRAQLDPLLTQLDPSWTVLERESAKHGSSLLLSRAFRFADFTTAMAFANRVAEMAESQHHHPDLHVAWGKAVVEIWTHKIGGLTESDFVFAAKCDALANT